MPHAIEQEHTARLDQRATTGTGGWVRLGSEAEASIAIADEAPVGGVAAHRLGRHAERCDERLDGLLEVDPPVRSLYGLFERLKDSGVLLSAPRPDRESVAQGKSVD